MTRYVLDTHVVSAIVRRRDPDLIARMSGHWRQSFGHNVVRKVGR